MKKAYASPILQQRKYVQELDATALLTVSGADGADNETELDWE